MATATTRSNNTKKKIENRSRRPNKTRQRRRQHQWVRTADVCFGTVVAKELRRLVDGGTKPNKALVSLAVTALNTVVYPFKELHEAVAAGEVIVLRIDDNERYALRDMLLTGEPMDPEMVDAWRRHLRPNM